MVHVREVKLHTDAPLGRGLQVDMLLLAGDLFHENRPSRTSLYQTISALRERCLGDRPVSLELVSDAGIGIPRDARCVTAVALVSPASRACLREGTDVGLRRPRAAGQASTTKTTTSTSDCRSFPSTATTTTRRVLVRYVFTLLCTSLVPRSLPS